MASFRVLVVLAVLLVGVAWADARNGYENSYGENQYRPILANGRYQPTRPGDANAERIRSNASVSREEPSKGRPSEAGGSEQRFEPRRPGESRLGEGSADAGERLVVSRSGRFEPRRPGEVGGDWGRSEDLGTALDGYRVLRGEELSPDFVAAEPWARDLEGTAKRRVKKALWKKLVAVPVKVAIKTVKKTVWKVAVGSWLPVL